MKLWEWILVAIAILWLMNRSQQAQPAPTAAGPALAPTDLLSDLAQPIPINNFFEQGGTEDVIYIPGGTSSGSSSGGSSGGSGGGGGGGGSTGAGTGRLR